MVKFERIKCHLNVRIVPIHKSKGPKLVVDPLQRKSCKGYLVLKMFNIMNRSEVVVIGNLTLIMKYF